MPKYSLIAAIIVAVVIQNTCPQGWTAKTAFATCGTIQHSPHCPLHEQKQSKQNGQDDAKGGISNAKQTFVLYIVRPDNTYQMLDGTHGTISSDLLTLTEIFSDPLLRPPISSLFI